MKLSHNDRKRGLKFPEKPNESLAEFIGILTGDGCMNYYPRNHEYFIDISGDKNLDKEYHINHVAGLIKKTFNLTPKIYSRKKENTRCIRILSKGLYNYLLILGFGKGRKEQIGIPKWIQKSDELMIAFIKGLADTDFSLVIKSVAGDKKYPSIVLKSKSKKLTFLVSKFLEKKGFVVCNWTETQRDARFLKYSTHHTLCLNGKRNLDLWMKMISFRNLRQYDKYVKYKKWDSGDLNSGL